MSNIPRENLTQACVELQHLAATANRYQQADLLLSRHDSAIEWQLIAREDHDDMWRLLAQLLGVEQ